MPPPTKKPKNQPTLAASPERASKFVKTSKRRRIGVNRLNALLMLFVHKDITVNVDKVLDLFAAKKSRRLDLAIPLAD